MKKIIPYLTLIPYLILIISLFFPYSALAVQTEFGPAADLAEYINKILTPLMVILGSISFLIVIWAGYLYMTSQGNPDKINLAKDLIIGVITGILFLFLIEIIMRQLVAPTLIKP